MAFLDLHDRSGRIQLQARVDELGDEGMAALLELDLGDVIGVDGVAFSTRRGELTLRIDALQLLAKSLRPLPEKHHGLKDVETRFRHRELDLIANEEARELFVTRARVISAIRRFLDAEGFIEVETPVLQPLYGGALARPFTTHHNPLDRDALPPDRDRAVPEAADRRRARAGLRARQGLPQRGRRLRPTTPSSRCSSSTRRSPTTATIAERCEQLVAYVAAEIGYAGPIDFTPPWRRETVRRGDPRPEPESTSSPPRARGAARPR